MYTLTEKGRTHVSLFIRECEAKRKEILDACKDTAHETNLPTECDVLDDVNWCGLDEDGEYWNAWGITDNYDLGIILRLGEDLNEGVQK